jgi:DNA-binding NtrC family response regulator
MPAEIANKVNPLISLSDRLHSCGEFETASSSLLRAMFQTIAASAEPNAALKILRGTIHFRPENEYRRLFSLEYEPRDTSALPLRLPSLTAWQWVASRGCPVTIDVDSQLLHVFEGGSPRLFRDQSTALRLNTGETCQRLTARDADYVLVYPLRRHAGIVDGMVSVELRDTNGKGDQIQSDCGSYLQLLVDLAAPHLANLPTAPASAVSQCDEHLPVVGASTSRLVELLRVFSGLEETLLITGPTGVGKSRLARYCHAHSSRRDKPFVTLDLLACPESLQLPQLCGAKRGAYTGADRDIPGAIQRAEGGTLFVDEIDKLSLQAQAGLLRLLEDRVYRCIGDSGNDRKADVRFIVGTIANLREAVEQGRFREDLYYRIAVLVVRVPPLVERADEIPAWANYMLERCANPNRGSQYTGQVQLHDSALTVLQGHSWPGNLRQLDNMVRRAYAYSLLEQHSGADSIVVSGAHLVRAMSDELDVDSQPDDDLSVAAQMKGAAKIFAEESLKRRSSHRPLPLALAESFRAMVLDAALEACDHDKDIALEALGLGNVIRDRNYQRVMKKESELLQRFYAAVSSGTEERPALPGRETD